jgi:hypothetical protein
VRDLRLSAQPRGDEELKVPAVNGAAVVQVASAGVSRLASVSAEQHFDEQTLIP